MLATLRLNTRTGRPAGEKPQGVLASPYAEIVGVPVALIGVAGFAGLFGLAAICLFMPQWGPCKLRVALVLVAAVGLCFELAMTGVEVFIIQAVCPY